MFDLGWVMKLHTSMSFRATTLKRSLWLVLLLGLIASPAFAQAPNSPIAFANQDAITVTYVSSPNVAVEGSSYSPNQDAKWLKVEFHYAVQPVKGDYLDAIEFKIWVEGRDLFAPDAPTKAGIAVGLTGSITYINILKNKDVYGVFYINPSTLARYSTERGVSDFEHKFDIHLEAYVGGALMDAIDKNKETDKAWFQQLRAVPGLVYRQNQCSFIATDVDRYPAIKLPEAAAQ